MSEMALRTALVTLYDGDSAVRALTGRDEKNLLLDGTVSDTPYPLTIYSFISAPKLQGTNGRRRIRMPFTAWADGRGASTDPLAVVESLMDRAVALFTGPNLQAQGVDAGVSPIDNRRDAPNASEGIVGLTNDFLIDLTI